MCYSVALILRCSCRMRISWVLWSNLIASTCLFSFYCACSYVLFCLFRSIRTLHSSFRLAFFSLTMFICSTAPMVSFSADVMLTYCLWYLSSDTMSLITRSKSSRCPRIVNCSLFLSPPRSVCSCLSNTYIARCEVSI
jgi:hypothetical protein